MSSLTVLIIMSRTDVQKWRVAEYFQLHLDTSSKKTWLGVSTRVPKDLANYFWNWEKNTNRFGALRLQCTKGRCERLLYKNITFFYLYTFLTIIRLLPFIIYQMLLYQKFKIYKTEPHMNLYRSLCLTNWVPISDF